MQPNLNAPFLHDPQINQKMVNKRTKIKKTQNTLEACFSEADSTESGAIVGSNDDLLTEILRRLPITSILRFKSVSKHWQSLMSHQCFTLSIDKVSVSPGLFVRYLYVPFDVENPTPPPFRTLNFYRDRSGIKIVQSCNGLLLCCSNRGTELTRKYYVFNPTTKQFAILPSIIGGSSASRTIRCIGLAFHQEDCVHYKLVCIRRVNRYNQNMFQIQIYSSDTGKWRISQDSLDASYLRSFSYEVNYGVYLNGAVHWITRGFNLVYFKFDVERLQTMLLPVMSSWSDGGKRYYFGESRGHLHLVQDAGNKNPLHLNVYEMLSDYSGWIIKYRVELDELPTAYPYLPKYEIEVFDVVRNEEKEESTAFMVVKILGKIIRYNVVDKSFKQLVDLPNVLYYQEIRYTNVHRFTQKLSSF